MKDKGFAVSTILMISWITVWMISYDNIWLKIPIIASIFPINLGNTTMQYSDFVTSIGIVGTLILALLVGYYAAGTAKDSIRGLHRT